MHIVNNKINLRELKICLQQLNKNKEDFKDYVINKIIQSTIGHIRYHFLDSHGPKYGLVTEQHSISVRYHIYQYINHNIFYYLYVLLVKELFE